MSVETAPQVTVLRATFDRVVVEPETLTKLWAYALAADIEVSCIGEVQVERESIIHVLPEQHVLVQENSSVRTEISASALAPLVTRYVKEGRSPRLLRFWWHSHVDMTATFSYTDDDTIKQLSRQMPGLFVAAVFNRRGESEWRAIYKDFTLTFKFTLGTALRPTKEQILETKTFLKPLIKEKTSWWRSRSDFGEGFPESGVTDWFKQKDYRADKGHKSKDQWKTRWNPKPKGNDDVTGR